MTEPLPFDAIVVVAPEGKRRYTVGQFLALPLGLRIRAILERRLEFFLGAAVVDVGTALKCLRQLSALDTRA